MLTHLIKLLCLASVAAFSKLPANCKLSSNTVIPIYPIMFDTPNINLFNKLVQMEVYNKPVGHIIVQQLSSILPQLDAISHTVLDINSYIIHYIIQDTNLSDEDKKKLILFTIKLVQDGDNVGSQILKNYFDIVNHCL